MNETILNVLKAMDKEAPATIDMIEKVEKEWNVLLPIGDMGYLSIWPIDEIVELNQEYAVDEFLPGIKYFGSDGADIAYGFEFDEDEILIIEIPFDSVRKSDAKKYSESFFDFLIGKDRNE